MMKIAKSKINGFIAEDAVCIYEERVQAKVQNQFEKALIDMLQFGISSASNEMTTASARFLETMVMGFFSRRAADDVVLQSSEGWSQSDTFMEAVVVRIVSSPLLIWPWAGFMKQHVDPIIDKRRLTQLYAETEKVEKKVVPL